MDFIKSQNINVFFYNLNDENIKRVHQLINKTNQFNLTTKRVSVVFLERELKKKWKFVISAKDKYGTHGIISFIYGSISNTSINIDNWVLSCRVFNKYIENSIIYFISNLLSKKNISKINTLLISTSKNGVLIEILKKVGFVNVKTENKKLFFT